MLTQVHSTIDYENFKSLPGNRGKSTINKKHFRRLLTSVEEKNLLHLRPIIINKENIIVDGHHRMAVAKKLQVPIYYMISDECGFNDAIRLTRGTTDWAVINYIEGIKEQGNPEYVKLYDFLQDTQISPHVLFRMLCIGRSQQLTDKIKEGKFLFSPQIDELKPTFIFIRDLIAKKIGVNRKSSKESLSRADFWLGVYLVLRFVEDSDVGLPQKLENYIDMISEKYSTYKSVVDNILSIYNYRLSDSKRKWKEDVLSEKFFKEIRVTCF